jgi:hypothetical protein
MSRLNLTLKFLLLAGIYVALIATVISLATRGASGSDWSVRASLGAQYSLALFLIPNALGFATSAILLRSRWATLTAPQILVASAAAVLLTLVLTFEIGLVLSPLVQMSESLVRPVAIIVTVLPGVLGGQILRLSRPRAVAKAA